MATTALNAPASRPGKRATSNPVAAGLPDPRPVTEYSAVYEEIDGHSRITVTLDQPCIIRKPNWRFVNCADGSTITAMTFDAPDNMTIIFDFAAIVEQMVAFVEVPYQDIEVQNFQGGFVRPGGQWFRKPE